MANSVRSEHRVTPSSGCDWDTDTVLNVAAMCGRTRALGPGIRAAVWVQGCAFHCPECIAPDWIPQRPARRVSPGTLVDELLSEPKVCGFTFSGGEPMLQAAGLAALIRLARRRRELSLICFSGYRLEQLRSRPPGSGVAALLDQVDVLIDGLYVEALNDGRGLRGSGNQRVHFLTKRLREADYDFEARPREVELHIGDGEALVVGVPPRGLLPTLEALHRPLRQALLRESRAVIAPERIEP